MIYNLISFGFPIYLILFEMIAKSFIIKDTVSFVAPALVSASIGILIGVLKPQKVPIIPDEDFIKKYQAEGLQFGLKNPKDDQLITITWFILLVELLAWYYVCMQSVKSTAPYSWDSYSFPLTIGILVYIFSLSLSIYKDTIAKDVNLIMIDNNNQRIVHAISDNINIEEAIKNTVIENKEEVKILLLSSQPINSITLNINDEFFGIKESILKSESIKFVVNEYNRCTPDIFLTKIIECNPKILHISGHSTHEGLIIENNEKQSHLLTEDSLIKILKIPNLQIDCLFINTSYSKNIATYISKYISYIICFDEPITDNFCISMSKGFYKGLSLGKDYITSFKIASALAEAENQNNAIHPILLVNGEEYKE